MYKESTCLMSQIWSTNSCRSFPGLKWTMNCVSANNWTYITNNKIYTRYVFTIYIEYFILCRNNVLHVYFYFFFKRKWLQSNEDTDYIVRWSFLSLIVCNSQENNVTHPQTQSTRFSGSGPIFTKICRRNSKRCIRLRVGRYSQIRQK
jgi:hypothetical protein